MMHKRKDLAFEILFFSLFICGTFSGVVLFRHGLEGHENWISSYGNEVFSASCFSAAGMAFSFLRPMAWLLLIAAMPGGIRLLPFFVFGRGMLSGYTSCMCCLSSKAPLYGLIRSILVVPAVYLLCRWIYRKKIRCYGHSL